MPFVSKSIEPLCRASVKGLLVGGLSTVFATAAFPQEELQFAENIEWIVQDYCSDCHGYGMKKGGVVLDEFGSEAEARAETDLWLRVLKNTRANIMPPADKPQPTPEEQARLEKWIKYAAFGIDPEFPDPGHVTLRRLNRVEYRNTVRDLLGSDFNSEVEFPADDTGHGFDNLGEVLTISPLLMEKYITAARAIVAETVPHTERAVFSRTIEGRDFLPAGGRDSLPADDEDVDRGTGARLSYYQPAKVGAAFHATKPGEYRLLLNVNIRGGFEFNAARAIVSFKVDDRVLWREELAWEQNKTFDLELTDQWAAGERQLTVEVQPLPDTHENDEPFDFRVYTVEVQGPTAREHWVTPPNYERFFSEGPAPVDPEARDAYAGRLLRDFATRAFRRPVDARTVDRLVQVARSVYSESDQTFEAGMARAMTAVLASPRFIFRIEETIDDPTDPNPHPRIDEWSLASRLSYFLWSTMPDDELFDLAERGELRNQLATQVTRMLRDPKAQAFVSNFTGQWLQTRDVEFIAIHPRNVLGVRATDVDFDKELRTAMRAESEKVFDYVLRNDRSVLEFLNADYTFLNERLAEHYGIPGVEGDEMQFVQLPPESRRGGVLTQGSVLTVTSNPTRTSPVKRGLFVLDNILGSPPPPPPPDIPSLEESKKEIAGHEPSLREILAVHRENPQCASCHNRMDPIGLALENFNALGMWRDHEVLPPPPREERRSAADFNVKREPKPEDFIPTLGPAIDASGKLITGETFEGVAELKQILVEDYPQIFYQNLTRKILTYAIGRGLDYRDVVTVDRITTELERDNGRFSTLIAAIINSAPFQRQQTPAATRVAVNASN